MTPPSNRQRAVEFSRRIWLGQGLLAAAAGVAWLRHSPGPVADEAGPPTPLYSITPVVGDGRWIWREPPPTARGYLEPREFSVVTTIRWTGQGAASDLAAAAVVPPPLAEQEILAQEVTTDGCAAEIQQLAECAWQLSSTLPELGPDQTASATVRQRLRICKSYFGHAREQFPQKQHVPPEIGAEYLRSSPGIHVRSQRVRNLAKELSAGIDHPWERARAYFDWVRAQLRPQLGPYTSVDAALHHRVGDCEEFAGVWIALCRASGIPARLVWVPNHAWAEFYLLDHQGTGHWIPVHPAAYSWFGWTGAHEVVLQKGDRIRRPPTNRQVRLVADWYRWQGVKPRVEFTAELQPLAANGQDAGPGARRKEVDGRWHLLVRHSADRWMRNE